MGESRIEDDESTFRRGALDAIGQLVLALLLRRAAVRSLGCKVGQPLFDRRSVSPP
jgi:hypothetical protein